MSETDYKKLYQSLKQHYELVPEEHPATNEVFDFLAKTIHLLFPQIRNTEDEVLNILRSLRASLVRLLKGFSKEIDAEASADLFVERLPLIQEMLVEDAKALCAGDPAAICVAEVIITYPGFYATMTHRIAHEFYKAGVPLFPRILSEFAHQQTGIDIHPGAQIAEGFCIDHGTGVVIGETCVIDKNVKIYQGVTLGGLSVDKSLASKKRHPTIEENVVIYSNATILGGETVIGKNSVIGGNVWLTSSVKSGSKVYHKAEINLKEKE